LSTSPVVVAALGRQAPQRWGPCPILLCPILLCPILLCPILLCPILLCPSVPCQILPYPISRRRKSACR
jgi:hypothetical protein